MFVRCSLLVIADFSHICIFLVFTLRGRAGADERNLAAREAVGHSGGYIAYAAPTDHKRGMERPLAADNVRPGDVQAEDGEDHLGDAGVVTSDVDVARGFVREDRALEHDPRPYNKGRILLAHESEAAVLKHASGKHGTLSLGDGSRDVHMNVEGATQTIVLSSNSREYIPENAIKTPAPEKTFALEDAHMYSDATCGDGNKLCEHLSKACVV